VDVGLPAEGKGEGRNGGGGRSGDWGVAWLNATRTQALTYVALPTGEVGDWEEETCVGLDWISPPLGAWLCVSHQANKPNLRFFIHFYLYFFKTKRLKKPSSCPRHLRLCACVGDSTGKARSFVEVSETRE